MASTKLKLMFPAPIGEQNGITTYYTPSDIAKALAADPTSLMILAKAINPDIIELDTPPTPPVQPPVITGPSTGINGAMNGYVPFGPNYPLNQSIQNNAVSARSAAIIAALGTPGVHVDNTVPYNVIDSSVIKPVNLDVDNTSESDVLPMHLENCAMEGSIGDGGDGHCLALDIRNGSVEEIFVDAGIQADGNLGCNCSAIFDSTVPPARPISFTSTDAAGTSLLHGLLKYNEVAVGFIPHAVRMTLPKTAPQEIVGSATHCAGLGTTANAVMGDRLRLAPNSDPRMAGVNFASLDPRVQTIVTCLQTFGAFVDDNGSAFFFTSDTDAGWMSDNAIILVQLKTIFNASMFDIVDVGEPQSYAQAQAAGSAPTISAFTPSKDANGFLNFSISQTGAGQMYITELPGVVRGSAAGPYTYKPGTYTLVAENLYGQVTATCLVS